MPTCNVNVPPDLRSVDALSPNLSPKQAGRGNITNLSASLIVCFLLASFSASGELPVDKNVKLPNAENVLDMTDAPMVAITGTQILVDGTPAGNTRSIVEANRLQRVDELFNVLKNKRELWKQLNPGKEFSGIVVLQVDRKVQALVVKSVFQTAAFAGYPNVSFMVGRLGQQG